MEILPVEQSSYSPFQYVSRPDFNPERFIKLAAGSVDGVSQASGSTGTSYGSARYAGGSGGGGGSSFASYG